MPRAAFAAQGMHAARLPCAWNGCTVQYEYSYEYIPRTSTAGQYESYYTTAYSYSTRKIILYCTSVLYTVRLVFHLWFFSCCIELQSVANRKKLTFKKLWFKINHFGSFLDVSQETV